MTDKLAPMMICAMPHSTRHGDFRAGLRLRADHPDIREHPEHWLPEGLDDDQWNTELRKRFEHIPSGLLR